MKRLLLIVLVAMSPSSVHALCVSKNLVKLKSGPGKRYPTNWEVLKYTPLRILKKGKDWLKVKDLDGDVHYVNSKDVSNNFMCSAITSSKGNVRAGPGFKFSKLTWAPVDKHYSFRLIKRKGPWAYVMDPYGDKGWVHNSIIWTN